MYALRMSDVNKEATYLLKIPHLRAKLWLFKQIQDSGCPPF